jgi:hypothetical protein
MSKPPIKYTELTRLQRARLASQANRRPPKITLPKLACLAKPLEPIETDGGRAMTAAFADVATKFGLRLKRQGHELIGPCPVCGGTDRFAINERKQLWNCRGCGRGGDAIDLVRHIERCSFKEAIAVLGGDSAHGRSPPVGGAADDDRSTLVCAARIWNQTTDLSPEAIAYFERRGISIDAVPDHGGLRWQAHCPWEGGTKPCVIGRYTTANGNEPRGIWRRPIDGSKPKALGPTAGCVIRLWPDDTVEQDLVLGEGVETTLAAATRIEHRGTLLQPAWAAGSAGNMAKFPALPGIEALTLLVDHDESGAGQRAAEECAARWEAFADVTLLAPTISNSDFNDWIAK